MKPTEQIAHKPSIVTGRFATLRGLLRGKGTGAPKIGQGTGAGAPTGIGAPSFTSARRRLAPLAGLVCLLGILGLMGASSALAAGPNGELPWWHLNAGARPTYLERTGTGHPAQAGLPKEQELITVPGDVEGGSNETYVILQVEGVLYKEFFSEGKYGLPEPTAVNFEKELEAAYGAGAVKVTEEPDTQPGAPAGATRFVIKGGTNTQPPIKVSTEGTDVVKENVLSNGTEPIKAKPEGEIYIEASNLGDASANGTANPVTIKDKLPKGVTAVSYEAISGGAGTGVKPGGESHGEVTCELTTPGEPTCSFSGLTGEGDEKILPPFGLIEARIGVDLSSEAHTGELNDVSVSGGYAQNKVAIERPIRLVEKAGEKTPFGIEAYEVTPENENGEVDNKAGSHPFQTTFTIAVNQGEGFQGLTGEPEAEPAGGPVRDVITKLPPGLIGNPTPFTRCTMPEFNAKQCPPSSIIGAASIVVNEPTEVGLKQFHDPIYNLEPAEGEPARFGFLPTKETPVFINASIRSGEDYGVTAESSNIVQVVSDLRAQLTFWGTPGDPRHVASSCLAAEAFPCFTAPNNPPPFFSLPTSCSGHPLDSVIEANSWSESELKSYDTSEFALSQQPMPTLSGCNRLPFEPSLIVTPDDHNASSPTGVNVDVHVPQGGQLNGKGLAQSALKETIVALPPGFAINPAASDGLEACSANPGSLAPKTYGTPGDQAGFKGFHEFDPITEPGVSEPVFTPYLPGDIAAVGATQSGAAELSENALTPGQNICPNGSKLGEVTIKSPLLPATQPLKGFIYQASQEANPFGGLLAIYILVEDPVSGSVVKLPGEVQLCKGAGQVINGITCEALGQIVTKFKNTPQLAFEDFEAHFFGGERAPLASPTRCGSYTTKATFVPWAGEENPNTHEINPAEVVHATSTYAVTAGPNGGPCPGASLPFNPSLTGGALNLQAGGFSPFTLSLTRQNGEQNMQSVEAHLPPGLSGLLSNVELCPEPQADEGKCGAGSLIGEATVGVGVGGDPFTVSGGKFYITGPYNGSGACTVGQAGCAPFGITFEIPAKAGPFDLAHTKSFSPPCDCIVTRGKIEINPYTSALTITSNPPGTAYSIPTELEGIPLEIQHINATTTRSAFQFNPSNCAKMEVTGTIHSSEGGTDTIGVPFQVTNCAALKFEPKFSVSTSGKTSKADGASLSAKVTYPKVPQGTDADIAKVKVELPKQLPSRLTTLQKACTAAQFEANPAACPSASKIGYAVVDTPLLPVPLTGPAIFVSHGGEAFPSLTMVLQGYGVTIDLVGTTFISKSGVTSTTFKTVPDQPFSSFTLTLPEGKYSALTALGNVCKENLQMPTEFIGQNGAAIHETSKIGVTGCGKTLTRSEKLKAALKACKKDKNKGKRSKCEKAARKKYGAVKKGKKPAKKKG